MSQISGTKFNAKDSFIGNVYFESNTGIGNIYKTWNKEKVSDFDNVSFFDELDNNEAVKSFIEKVQGGEA